MFKPKRITLALAGSVLALGLGSQVIAGPVATVNGVAIPESRLNAFVQQLVQRGNPDSPELRARVKDKLIQDELLVQAAVGKGLDKSADVVSALDNARSQILIDAYIADYFKRNPISDAEIQKLYNASKASMPSQQFKVRHILVKTEAEAKEILAALAKGQKFDALAKAKSIDPGSKVNGGLLNGPDGGEWVIPQLFVKEFAEAIPTIKPGTYSKAAIKTQFGFHIIRVEAAQAFKAPSVQELRPRLEQELRGQMLEKMLGELRQSAKVQ